MIICCFDFMSSCTSPIWCHPCWETWLNDNWFFYWPTWVLFISLVNLFSHYIQSSLAFVNCFSNLFTKIFFFFFGRSDRFIFVFLLRQLSYQYNVNELKAFCFGLSIPHQLLLSIIMLFVGIKFSSTFDFIFLQTCTNNVP